MPKTVIIGAGISGLVAACCLAADGHDVTVLEKNDGVGGRARAYREQGYLFDMGPSWYWMPDVFESFFNRFGKSASDYYRLVQLDPGFRMFFRDQPALDIPAGMQALQREFEQIEPGSGARLAAFLNDAAYKYHEGMLKLAFKPSVSASEYLDIGLLAKMVRLKMFTSGARHVRKYFTDPRLISLMEFPLLFLGATPAKIPSLYSLMNYAALQQGTWYPIGGMYKIIEAFQKLAESLGAKIYTRYPVSRIHVHDKLVREVSAGFGRFPADAVVAAGDYAHMETLLEPEYRNYSARYWQQKTFAPSCLIFYLGVNRRVPGLLHHNLFFDADFGRHAAQIYDHPAWPDDPLFYVCCPSKTDNTVAPEGCENLFVLMPVATGLKDDSATHERYYDVIMNRIEAQTGVPVRQHVVHKRMYSGENFISDYNAFGGNAYGLANTLVQTAILKPRMANKMVKNLVYTGQLTVPGPGIPPCIISGQIAAKLISQKHAHL